MVSGEYIFTHDPESYFAKTKEHPHTTIFVDGNTLITAVDGKGFKLLTPKDLFKYPTDRIWNVFMTVNGEEIEPRKIVASTVTVG